MTEERLPCTKCGHDVTEGVALRCEAVPCPALWQLMRMPPKPPRTIACPDEDCDADCETCGGRGRVEIDPNG